MSFLQDRFSALIDAEVERRMETEASLREETERQERERLLLEKEQELERLRVAHEREMYLIKKKLSSAATPSHLPVNRDCRIQIQIPEYHTAGVGKASYTEYT